MAVSLERESTEYLYLGLTGTPPSVSAEVAFLAPGVRPTDPDWSSALVVEDQSDPLWADAVASGVAGDYYVARLVGSYGDNDVAPEVGDYQVWLRLTDTTERPVRIAPVALEVT
ncbi:hypothetical protein ACIBI0_38800 [Microbispora rosea]|uniref:hypothetical protein n=1 Tax=Microbispora rosea TaxID=58117 RepID=UPI0037A46C06